MVRRLDATGKGVTGHSLEPPYRSTSVARLQQRQFELKQSGGGVQGRGPLRSHPLVALCLLSADAESRGPCGLSTAQREKVYVFEEIEVKRWVIPA